MKGKFWIFPALWVPLVLTLLSLGGEEDPDSTPPRIFTPDDFKNHVKSLNRKIGDRDFHIVIQPPFVVIGDESRKMVKRRAAGTVKWAVDRLKRDFFSRDPKHILDIWLFKDRESYLKHTRELFGHHPDTPFGYYSSEHRALIMNIHTGGGTLVHEIVHPFMASNFPRCPAWFNEGLASLYEQSGDRDGRITGFTNWRLRGLQEGIRKKAVPPFEVLCGTTTHAFYEKDPGTNYAQARYLCYYLQEKGLLIKYYHAFRKSAKEDPTGLETLRKVLGEPDMEAFKKKWEAFVMKLRF